MEIQVNLSLFLVNKQQKTKLEIIQLFGKVLQQLYMQVMERGECLKKFNIGS